MRRAVIAADILWCPWTILCPNLYWVLLDSPFSNLGDVLINPFWSFALDLVYSSFDINDWSECWSFRSLANHNALHSVHSRSNSTLTRFEVHLILYPHPRSTWQMYLVSLYCWREEYQGLKAGNERTEEMFDAGAKYHTIANVPYIR